MRKRRIIWILVCVIALAIAPWWVFALLVLGGIIFFPHAYEALVLAAAADGLFATTVWAHGLFPFTFATALLLLASHYIRTRIR
jgi:hypothetical protein